MRILRDRQTQIGKLLTISGIVLIGQLWISWKEFLNSGNNLFWNQPLLADGIAGDVSITSVGLVFMLVSIALFLAGAAMVRYAYLSRSKKVELKKNKK